MKRTLFLVLALGFLSFSSAYGQAERPSDLKFPELTYNPPDPKALRTVFAGGLRGFILEDGSLPLVNVSAVLDFGRLHDPEGKAGLAELLAASLIKGGTRTRTGPEIEDRLDFLGAALTFNAGERISTLSLTVMSRDVDEGLAVFFDVLMNPEFREDEVKLERTRLIEGLRQANDQPSVILAREFERLLYGDHPLTRQPSRASLESVTVADLKSAHGRFFVPGNAVLAASGDFRRAAFKRAAERIIAPWKNRRLDTPVFSRSFPGAEPGVYFIQRPISQGYISLGHLGLEDTHPDYYAVQVMNFILGGGSFTSRITSKVRSDEGLSYNQGSRFAYRWGFPGTFSGYVQTKSSTAAFAISLILKEFERIRTEPVSDEELETAVNYYLESFSDAFQTPQATTSTFAGLELSGKPLEYYDRFRDRIRAVTRDKVLEAARKYVRPDKAVILIVGDWEPCNKGSDKLPGPLERFGKVHRVELFDPMTGAPLKTP
jgi:predicted Zn-dependent peptidase